MTDIDYTKAIFGVNAVHVPAWMYVQHQDDGTVAFVGASKVNAAEHPLRYGSGRTHQFVLGEIIVRPHLVVATDVLRGHGLQHLVGGHDIEELLDDGEIVLDMGGGFQMGAAPDPAAGKS